MLFACSFHHSCTDESSSLLFSVHEKVWQVVSGQISPTLFGECWCLIVNPGVNGFDHVCGGLKASGEV